MASGTKSTVFRVTGLPGDRPVPEIRSELDRTISSLLTNDETQQVKVHITCIPTCDGSETSSAQVEFEGGKPGFLSHLEDNPLSSWQVEMGDDDISFDRHFFGFTQLYPTDPGRTIAADIIAITGLDGHAYGSWRGRGNLGRMWLRDFLRKDIPNCRVMIYGYNSKLSSHGVHTIMDYGRGFLEALKRVRNTQELRERPLIFIAHSFGGIILAHCLVKAVQTDERDHATIAALHKATYGILFFGTPHLGLPTDDIQGMISNKHPRMALIGQIESGSDLLIYQRADFRNLIRDRKIISFYETQQTRGLQLNADTGLWGRTGAYITAVKMDSALLGLPDSMETPIPVDADHSHIVKFDSRNEEAYKAALGYLKKFAGDAGKVVADRFSPTSRKKSPRSTVPFARDLKFIGRQDIISALDHQFSQVDQHSRAVLVGLGGVGKSQIAIEYSYRPRDDDPNMWVFWVYASTAERFEQAYRSIAIELGLPDSDNPKADIMSLVSRWLSNPDNGRWFMILDNADDVEMFLPTKERESKLPISLLSHIPQTITGSVLFTTRDRRAVSRLSTGFQSIVPVNMMAPEEAENLLRINIPEGLSTGTDAAELVKELDYLPLAITQAAAYISVNLIRMNVSRYLILYRQDDINQGRLLDVDAGDLRRDPSVPNSVIRTWQISFDQIKQKKPQSAKLLSLMAMLDRQAIPESLLCIEYPDALDFEAALASLHEFSLITIKKGGKSFDMHRLVQLSTRRWLELNKEITTWQSAAIEILAEAFPNGDYHNWKICEALYSHSLEVLKYKGESRQSLLKQASILYNLAWYNWLQGRYDLAKAVGRECLDAREELLEDLDSRVLDSAAMLALVLRYQGKYDEAETMNRRVLVGYEATLGQDHPNTLMSLSNLASVLQGQGKYDEAETINRRVLAGREATLGQDHPDTLVSLSNLASVLQGQGKYDEAEMINRRVLVGREVTLGLDHPDTLTSAWWLANLFEMQGNTEAAAPQYVRAVSGYQKVLGNTHPTTLACSTRYSAMLKKLELPLAYV